MALEYPNNLKYFDSHEYVRLDGEIATIGISAYAIDQLGDIVFLELPEVGTQASKGDSFGNIESVKAVEEIYAPLSGEVVECNGAMVDAPEQLVEDPYENGWLVKIRINDPNELEGAMSAEAYRALVAGD
ncbi:MAG: glycine cleavage system protein GcvH [Cyanobacteria bacterium J06641_5]